jgi:hypothetical protein
MNNIVRYVVYAIIVGLLLCSRYQNCKTKECLDGKCRQVEKQQEVIEELQSDLIYLETRYLELPRDDSGRWSTILITSDNPEQNPNEQAMIEWFRSDSHLHTLKATSNFYHYKESNPMYKSRFKAFYGSNYPILALQKGKGQVVYKVSGENIPSNVKELVFDLDKAIEQCRPQPKVEPKKEPFRPLQIVPDKVTIDHDIPSLGIDKAIDSLSLLANKYLIYIVLGLGVLWFINKEDE